MALSRLLQQGWQELSNGKIMNYFGLLDGLSGVGLAGLDSHAVLHIKSLSVLDQEH